MLSKDMAIVLKLLTFAIPKDNNAFFDWQMLQVSTYMPNYGPRAQKTVIADEPCYVCAFR